MKVLLPMLVLLFATQSMATSINPHYLPDKLPNNIQAIISDKLKFGPGSRLEAKDMLQDILVQIEPERTSAPDELKGCVTRTRTRCTGTGKDKVCETDSWEVCIGS